MTEVTQEVVDTFLFIIHIHLLQSLQTICKRIIYFEAIIKFLQADILYGLTKNNTKYLSKTFSHKFWSQLLEYLLFLIF